MLFFTIFAFFSQENRIFLPVPTRSTPVFFTYIDVFIHLIYPTFMVLPRVYGFTLPYTLPHRDPLSLSLYLTP